MEQLGGLDNLMIEGETPNLPMHMSAAMLYDARKAGGAESLFAQLGALFEDIIDSKLPILACRVDELPLQVDKAYWVEDRHFKLANHISRSTLPSPNDWPAFHHLFGQFHSAPLDHTRPLWQLVLVDGLDKVDGIPRGSCALFLKIHHAVMDGKSAIRLMRSLHSKTRQGQPLAYSLKDAAPGGAKFRAPAWWQKAGRAWLHGIERPVEMAADITHHLPGLLRHSTRQAVHKEPAHTIPRVSFNDTVDADRIVGHVRMNRKQLEALAGEQHCTLNDLALCVVGGALRDYLKNAGELPADSLVAAMPIDVRRANTDGELGNHISMAKVSLRTDTRGVKTRLRSIRQEAHSHARESRSGDSHAGLKLIDEIHPAIILWLGQWLINSGLIGKLPQIVNTVISNVPGLPGRNYLFGARLIDYLGFGPLAPLVGLFHTISSTDKHINISFVSTRTFMADGSTYTAALDASYQQLLRAFSKT